MPFWPAFAHSHPLGKRFNKKTNLLFYFYVFLVQEFQYTYISQQGDIISEQTDKKSELTVSEMPELFNIGRSKI